ncbi:hypothetical protein [Shouchella shacheensis]|uniref:hypothetical protein n=1 Tax=Shouchella shacheensis TaxID=1649580 RepID=UPI00073FD678|nr:hypothetical protein [Shouchella shacheensis]
MEQKKFMYILGLILLVLNLIGFAIQGSFLEGGLFITVAIAIYMGLVYLHYHSAKTQTFSSLFVLVMGVLVVTGALYAFATDGYLL